MLTGMKFRAWDKEENKFTDEFFISPGGFVLWDGGYDAPFDAEDRLVITRFTSFNYVGDDIYEEDIFENVDTKAKFKVVFREGSFMADYGHAIILLANALENLPKKLGNSFENPELLNHQ